MKCKLSATYSQKKLIRDNYINVVQKPRLWPVAMKVICNSAWSRIKYDKQTVYYSEISIDDLLERNNSIEDSSLVTVISINSIDNICAIRDARDEETRLALSDTIRKRLDRKDICFVLFLNDSPVTYLWVSTGNVLVETLGMPYLLNEDCYAIYDVFTSPLHRGHGYYKTLLRSVGIIMKKQEYNRAGLWIMRHNRTAIRTQNDCGFQYVSKEIGYRSFMGLKRFFIHNVDYSMLDLLT